MAYHTLPILNESVSAVTATNSVDLGTVRVFGGEEYVYLYNDGGASITVGYAAVLNSGATGYSVTVTSVSQTENCCLGFVKHATVPTGNYFWALSKGFTNVKNAMASTALAVFDGLILGVNGQVAVNYIPTTPTFIGPTIGFVAQATGSAGTAYAFVRCFGS